MEGPKISRNPSVRMRLTAPGHDQRGQKLLIEKADDQALKDNAREAGSYPRQYNRDGFGNASVIGECGDVGANHHQLAVRHVDDAHHAENNDEAHSGEKKEADVIGVLIDKAKYYGQRFQFCLSCAFFARLSMRGEGKVAATGRVASRRPPESEVSLACYCPSKKPVHSGLSRGRKGRPGAFSLMSTPMSWRKVGSVKPRSATKCRVCSASMLNR